MTKILEFLASVALLPRNDVGNFRIPYRDPPVKLGDDREFRIPKNKFRNSLRMNLEFLEIDLLPHNDIGNSRIP